MFNREMIDAINAVCERSNAPNSRDYIKEGLYHCYKCNTPKQALIEFNGEHIKVACLCECKERELREREKEQARMKKDEYIDYLKFSGLPDKRMREWTFDNAIKNEVIAAAENYAADFDYYVERRKGLLLYGSVGTGKTYAAVCVANYLMDKGIPCLVTSLTRLYNETEYGNSQGILDSLSKYKLIVLDDFGSERSTEAMNELAYSVIDARSLSGLPMIVTTNLGLSDFRTGGEKQRLYSRLYQSCVFIEAKGSDKRAEEYRRSAGKIRRGLYE